jgi:carbonic anhydrase
MKFVAAILPLIASATASCLYGTSLMPRAADGTVPTITYNYTYTGGPLNWYGLDESKNSACAKGMYQSPIVIYTNEIQYAAAGSVNFSVPVADNAKFENLGFYLEVVLPNGTLSTPLGTYSLVQFHFHVPSEHRINDEHFPMEARFVFETSKY